MGPHGVVGGRVGADRLQLGRGAAATAAAARSASSGTDRGRAPRGAPEHRRCCRSSSTRRRGRAPTASRFTSPPKQRSDYVTYLAALVERYGPDGHVLDGATRTCRSARCASGRSGTSRTCPPTGTPRRTGPYGYARAYPLLLRASYNIVKSARPGREDRDGGPHAAGVGGDRGALPARHQALLRRRGAPDLPADGEARREGHRSSSATRCAGAATAQADLPDRDHLAGLEGAHAGDQVPAPGDAARDGHAS